MTRSRPHVGVGTVLLRPDGAVLLGHRIKRGEQPSWCLPGGHLEIGEDFAQAAVRETEEEAGLVAAGPRVFAVLVDHVHGGVTAGVAARYTGGNPQVRESHVFDRWEWRSLSTPSTPLFPASEALLAVWAGRPAPSGWSVHRIVPEDSP